MPAFKYLEGYGLIDCYMNSFHIYFKMKYSANDGSLAVWKGGSILAMTSIVDGMWLSKQKYHEYGESITRRIWY